MKFVFVSYVASLGFNDPDAWIKHINFYSGIPAALAVTDTVISIEQINYEGSLVKNGVQYYFKKTTALERLFPHQLHSFLKNLKPDVVVVQGLHFPLQTIQLRLMLGKNVSILLQNHAEKPFNRIRKPLQQLADRYVDAYFFASKTMGLNWVKRGNLASAEKIHEVMEVSSVFAPIQRSCAQSKTGITAQQLAFLWVGRLNQNKDPLTVVKAFLRFIDRQPSAKLYMVYQNEELLGEIKQLLDTHPSGNKNIVLIGRLHHHELLYWYNSVDFIISGSHYEGSGAAVCEAMSCGCIPVLTDIDSFRAITNNGSCGILYEAGNETDLLSVLNTIPNINIPKMRDLVLTHYQATLSFEAIANRFRQVATALRS